MAGRTPNEAFETYIEPLRAALGCVTRARLTLRGRERLDVERPYPVALDGGDPIPLRGYAPITFTVAQTVRVVRAEVSAQSGGHYTIQLAAYAYRFGTSSGDEILTFQWTPEAVGEGAITFPHLHVGPAISREQQAIRPDTFHKVHVPTGRITLEAMIRLAIVEFGVPPLAERRADWRTILRFAEETHQ